jgi:hypothetical protein
MPCDSSPIALLIRYWTIEILMKSHSYHAQYQILRNARDVKHNVYSSNQRENHSILSSKNLKDSDPVLV